LIFIIRIIVILLKLRKERKNKDGRSGRVEIGSYKKGIAEEGKYLINRR
jgi:hypothetical protein